MDAKDYIEAAAAVGGVLSGLAAMLAVLERNSEHIPLETWRKMEEMEGQLRELLKKEDNGNDSGTRGSTPISRPAD